MIDRKQRKNTYTLKTDGTKQWQCHACGFESEWDENWRYFGPENKMKLIVCSMECTETAADEVRDILKDSPSVKEAEKEAEESNNPIPQLETTIKKWQKNAIKAGVVEFKYDLGDGIDISITRTNDGFLSMDESSIYPTEKDAAKASIGILKDRFKEALRAAKLAVRDL